MNKKNATENKKNKKSFGRIFIRVFLIIILCLVILAAGAFFYIRENYSMDKIQVTGNTHYTEDEIKEIFSEQTKLDNTVFFMLENKLHPVSDIPFVAKFDVEIINRHTVTITVYEKGMAGCILYMDQYVYFDDNGKVLETSAEKLPDVPCIDGLKFDSIVMGEELPVDDEDMFQDILTMTQMIDKNELVIDRIRYDSEGNIILYKDNIKIILGNGGQLEDKIMNLGNILSEVEGKSGTLDMSNYENNNGNVIFKENK